MAKAVPDAIIDAMLAVFSTNCDLLTVCATQPTTYTEAATTNKLADIAIDGADFTAANGDTSGRKITIAQQTGVTIDTAGTADHIALVDVGNTTLYAVTTCAGVALSTPGTVTVNAFDIEVSDVS